MRYKRTLTFTELADIYSKPLPEQNEQLAPITVYRHEKGDWLGGLKSQAHAVSLLQQGWHEGADKAKKLAIELEKEIPAPQSRRRRQVWGEDGHTLDVDRAMAGDWDHAWRTSRREVSTGSQIVDLVFAWNFMASVSAESLFWTGAAALAITDLLENAGYAVKLSGVMAGEDDRHEQMTFITMKEADEPLRVDALAAVASHAGVYRTFGFRVLASAPFKVRTGLGRAMKFSEVAEDLPEGSMQIDLCLSRDAAIRAVREIVKRVSKGSTESED